MPKIILFNGPPGSGKDVCAEYVTRMYLGLNKMEFKECLFSLCKLVYNISDDGWNKFYTRELKEIPRVELKGRSPREALIHMSEEVIKPSFGREFFGNWIAGRIEMHLRLLPYKGFVFSDSGFLEEALPLIEKFGAKNVMIVCLYREGYTFEGDSRDYLQQGDLPVDVRFEKLYNNGSLNELLTNSLKLSEQFLWQDNENII